MRKILSLAYYNLNNRLILVEPGEEFDSKQMKVVSIVDSIIYRNSNAFDIELDNKQIVTVFQPHSIYTEVELSPPHKS